MEWAILPYGNNSGSSPAMGDSGSVIVNSSRCISGLLTGGSGIKDLLDMTYAMPIDFVMRAIHSNKDLTKAYIITAPPPWALPQVIGEQPFLPDLFTRRAEITFSIFTGC